jgi:carbon monoxide dehydrogenase subunit G
MEFVNTARVPAPRESVWAFLKDLEAVGRCVPGVETVERGDDGAYRGAIRVKVGPISLQLTGALVLESRDDAAHVSRMRARAADTRVSGSVNARIAMEVGEVSLTESELVVRTDAAILGKLGEFGQPLMRKKADSLMAEFAANLARQVAGTPGGPASGARA